MGPARYAATRRREAARRRAALRRGGDVLTDGVTLLGLPWDRSSSCERGAAAAPAEIRRALHSPARSLWTEDGVDLAPLLDDAGDLPLTDDAAAARAAITAGIGAIAARGRRPLALGGDHSVTLPALAAVHAAHGPVDVLVVDAHPDLYDEYDGDRYSHACPFARGCEAGYVRRLVQVGIRAATGHGREQAERFGAEWIEMDAWAAGARPKLLGAVYVSLDLDGLDPAFAPGVAHREPGGLSVRDVIGVLQPLEGPVVAGDIVELNPARDLDGVTAAVAAKLVRELASAMLR